MSGRAYFVPFSKENPGLYRRTRFEYEFLAALQLEPVGDIRRQAELEILRRRFSIKHVSSDFTDSVLRKSNKSIN